ncbi:MAG: DMT family transporter [Arenicellales bacterium]
MMLLGVSIVPLMDGLAKHLARHYPIGQIVWGRFFFHFMFILPVMLIRYRSDVLRVQQPVLQILRGGFLLVATGCFFWSLKRLAIPDALTLLFVSPLLVTCLSPVLLGEHVGVRRWSAVVVGFIGVCIMLRPGGGALQLASFAALGAGFCHACYILATRRLSGTAPPLVTLFYTSVLGMVVLSFYVPWHWVAPLKMDFAAMVAIGAIAAAGHFLLIKAFDHAEASVLAPFGYGEIVMATIVGYLGFGDFPDAVTWLGMAVIIGSGVYIAVREHEKHVGVPPDEGTVVG